jgi:hypothetical protein
VTASGTTPLNYQWQMAGTNVPGATAASLQLASVQPSQAGGYSVIVTNVAGAATSSVATLAVLVPPQIVSQPTNVTVISGSNATFSVTASGTAPLNYQWQTAGTDVPGATAASLQLANVQPSQAGGYRVIVTNVAGTATSSVATLAVLVPPQIVSQPTNVTIISGSNATFSVTALGTTPLTYQWQMAGTNLPGATATDLQVSNAQPAEAGDYQVIVTNILGAATSSVAILTILVPPQILSEPTNVTTVPGGAATFSVLASGSAPVAYQWQFASTNLPGGTTSTLQLGNVQPAQAGSYLVVVTDSAGASTSAPASLRLLVAPLLSSITKTGDTASISFPGVQGLIYTLEYQDVFTGAVWTPILPGTTGIDGVLLLQDTQATNSSRFYRVLTK